MCGTHSQGLEISEFLSQSLTNSLQCACVYAELPVLELLLFKHTLIDAQQYLQVEYMLNHRCNFTSTPKSFLKAHAGGMLPESHSRLSREECERLRENMDYSVGGASCERISKEPAGRTRWSYELAIRLSGVLLSCLLNLVQV
jgi:hypothetical protein